MTMEFNKLVRDKIPEVIKAEGRIVNYRILGPEEFLHELKIKLAEEASEAARATTREELIAELADLSEVRKYLLVASGITEADILSAALAKNASRGSFQDRIFLENCSDVDV